MVTPGVGSMCRCFMHFEVGSQRLEEHLGSMNGEVYKSFFGVCVSNRQKLLILKSLTELIALAFPEGHGYERFYDKVVDFLEHDLGSKDALLEYFARRRLTENTRDLPGNPEPSAGHRGAD